jgi:adiponectin receptor
MKDNDKITDGYRINFKTTTSIIKSMFMLHNESVNIWTHCLPAFFLIFFLVSFCMAIDANDFTATFKQYRKDVEHSLHSYHLSLKNATLL